MSDFASYCGANCPGCEVYIATVNNDNALKSRIADQWRMQYETGFVSEEIHCEGCKANGKRAFYCDAVCKIRACATSKNIDICFLCSDFPCIIINEEEYIFAKRRLTALKLNNQ